MKAFQIEETGDFMRKLLLQNTFDKFYLTEGEVTGQVSWQVDGGLSRDFYDPEELEALGGRKLALWGEVKPVVYEMIKGKKLPVQFFFVLQLSAENTDWLLEKYKLSQLSESLAGLYLNIRYRSKRLTCTSGLSYKTFVMDKRLEQIWDETAARFLRQSGITAEEI